MKKNILIFTALAALLLAGCGQVEESSAAKDSSVAESSSAEQAASDEKTEETTAEEISAEPTKPDLAADMSSVNAAVKEVEEVFSGQTLNDGSTFEGFAHPDALYCTEPQLTYDLGKTAVPSQYMAYIIDTETDLIAAEVGFLEDGTAAATLVDPSSQLESEDYPVPKLYREGKGFIFARGKEHSPVYIVDGEVYYSLLSKPDISAMDFAEAKPLEPLYKVELN
ncbi:hypothetical protein [Ruminococcus sp.]|uniref:hypothetical protein n=1 Tax=Ruminococcus sp. TaxID=41978 RepID=UPI0025DD1D61|nr:hypothetical protein [Ruminococcus sp.]MBQ8965088.1 hypothetical protein [Ruminococcus sp.]